MQNNDQNRSSGSGSGSSYQHGKRQTDQNATDNGYQTTGSPASSFDE